MSASGPCQPCPASPCTEGRLRSARSPPMSPRASPIHPCLLPPNACSEGSGAGPHLRQSEVSVGLQCRQRDAGGAGHTVGSLCLEAWCSTEPREAPEWDGAMMTASLRQAGAARAVTAWSAPLQSLAIQLPVPGGTGGRGAVWAPKNFLILQFLMYSHKQFLSSLPLSLPQSHSSLSHTHTYT